MKKVILLFAFLLALGACSLNNLTKGWEVTIESPKNGEVISHLNPEFTLSIRRILDKDYKDLIVSIYLSDKSGDSMKKIYEEKFKPADIVNVHARPDILLSNGKTYYWKAVLKVVYNDINNRPAYKLFQSQIMQFKTSAKNIILKSPREGEIIYSSNVNLQWEKIEEASYYDIYMSTSCEFSEELRLFSKMYKIADGVTINSYSVKNLSFNNTYYWSVVAKNDEGKIVGVSSVQLFSLEREFKINVFKFKTYKPNLINTYIQVYKRGYPAQDLDSTDFMIEDDGEEIEKDESYFGVKKYSNVNYTFKTVVAVDVSGSISHEELNKIKESLKALINAKPTFQEIAIVAFDDSPKTIIDFTSDKEKLITAVDKLRRSPMSSTDLYGAVIHSVNMWEDYTDADKVVMGILILITDGKDTAGKFSLNEALEARGEKKIYTVGVGKDVDVYVLKEIGNEGFSYIESFDLLESKLKYIQKYIGEYANSFYLIYYLTSRRSGIHTMKLIVNDTTVSVDYNASGFYDPDVEIDILKLSTSTKIATLTLSTSMEIVSPIATEFLFPNPVYKLIGECTSDASYISDVPAVNDYNFATLTLLFSRENFSGTVTVLDEKYHILKEIFLNLK